MEDVPHLAKSSPGVVGPVVEKSALASTENSASLEQLKVRLTDAQKAIRKVRYTRQGFVPPGTMWRGVLLSDVADSEIATELGLSFETREISLTTEGEAKLWILERVLENPHLNAFQRIRANLQHKALLLEQGRAHMAAEKPGLTEMSNPNPHNTRAQIAKASGSSEGQVHKVETLLEHAAPAMLQDLEAGTLKIGAAFDALRAPSPSEEETTHYGVIYVDATLGLDAKRLRALPVPQLADDDATLFCRVHPCDLAKVLRCLRSWGFVYRTHLVQPLSRPLMGDFLQEGHDLLILATRGEVPTPGVEDCPSSMLPAMSADEPAPEVAYGVMERLFPEATRVQLSAAPGRANWTSWSPGRHLPASD